VWKLRGSLCLLHLYHFTFLVVVIEPKNLIEKVDVFGGLILSTPFGAPSLESFIHHPLAIEDPVITFYAEDSRILLGEAIFSPGDIHRIIESFLAN
jgi:hypothetical protein